MWTSHLIWFPTISLSPGHARCGVASTRPLECLAEIHKLLCYLWPVTVLLPPITIQTLSNPLCAFPSIFLSSSGPENSQSISLCHYSVCEVLGRYPGLPAGHLPESFPFYFFNPMDFISLTDLWDYKKNFMCVLFSCCFQTCLGIIFLPLIQGVDLWKDGEN